ncbi:MAG: sigma-70 family RNA polymerase sigma factor [Motiliproteus sp.]
MDALTTDESLMLEYAGGSYEAFEVLYTRHKSSVLRFYRRQIGTAAAEELLHDAFMRLINARQRYTPSATFRTYFWTIVRNVLIDHYRKLNRSLPESYGAIDPEQSIADESVEPDVGADQSRQIQKLLAIVSTLPSAQREAFLLKEEAGLTLPEIAEIAQTSVDTIKSRLRYAVTKIRNGMEAI